MATNIFELFGTITADGAPANRAIDEVVGKAKKADDQIFGTIAKGLQGTGKFLTNTGQKLTNWITKPVLAAGTALGGLTIKKGFDRALQIDTARAKLIGLGHDTKSVDTIMDSALTSVKGTSFGLGEAATIAASAVAAGVDPTKELTRYLSLTGDASAIAGTSLNEMGSIFNKVQTQNKAYNSELQQLSERGIPIYQWLAEEMGVAEEAVFDLASQGRISSADFLNAIDKNIGGAAKKIGEVSTAAAWDNLWASIGRLGEAFLGAGDDANGFFAQLRPLFGELTQMFDSLAPKAEELGRKFGQAFMTLVDTIRNLITWFAGLDSNTQKLIGAFGAFLIVLGPLLKFFGGLVTGVGNLIDAYLKLKPVVATIAGAFGLTSKALVILVAKVAGVIAIFAALAAGFVYLYNTNETFRNAVDVAWNFIKETITTIASAVFDFVTDIFNRLATFFNENQELIRQTIDTVWSAIQTVIEVALAVIVPIITNAWELIKVLTQTVWDNIKSVIMIALELILGVIETVMHLINGNWSEAWETIKSTASTVWDLIVEMINTRLENLKALFDTVFGPIVDWVVQKWEELKLRTIEIWESIKGFFTETIPGIVNGIVEWFQQLPTRISEFFQMVISSAVEWVTGLIAKAGELKAGFVDFIIQTFGYMPDGIGEFLGLIISYVIVWGAKMVAKGVEVGIQFVTNIINWFQQLPGKIQEFISNAYDRVVTWASQMWNKAKETGSRFLSNIVSFFTQLPGRVQTFLSNTISRVTTWVSQMVSKAKQAGSQFINSVINFIRQLPGKIQTFLSNTISRVVQFAGQMRAKGAQAARNLVSAVTNGVRSLPSKMASAGRNVVKGFWNGIKGLGGWLRSQVNGFFTGIVNGAKAALGIKSPSRVFMEIGKFVDEGFGVGISDNAKKAIQPVKKMTDQIIKAASNMQVDVDPFNVNEESIRPVDIRGAVENDQYSRQTKDDEHSKFQRVMNSWMDKLERIVNQQQPIYVTLDGQVIARATRDPLDKEFSYKNKDHDLGKGRK